MPRRLNDGKVNQVNHISNLAGYATVDSLLLSVSICIKKGADVMSDHFYVTIFFTAITELSEYNV